MNNTGDDVLELPVTVMRSHRKRARSSKSAAVTPITRSPTISRSEELEPRDSIRTTRNSGFVAPGPLSSDVFVIHTQSDVANLVNHLRGHSESACSPRLPPAGNEEGGEAAIIPSPCSKWQFIAFTFAGWLRRVSLIAIGVMGVWPLALQLICEPSSVFGDGHGDRYQQPSYFAMENDHYQILRPRKMSCTDLKTVLMGDIVPTATQDLVRAVPYSVFQTVRNLTVNQTNCSDATGLSVPTDILPLASTKSLCFGGVDDEGSIQIEALLSARDAPSFGIDGACLPATAAHLRLRLQPTEFFYADAMGELNPARTSGALLIVSPIDQDLRPVISSCHKYTRQERFNATKSALDYQWLLSRYSQRLLVTSDCHAFNVFGGARDTFGCAYSALGASGAVADLLSDGASRTYSFPAPWSMIQCTVSGECSTLQFSQMWLSEYTVEYVSGSAVLRHNFVNQKVIDVTVDSTFSLRVVISLQILGLVFTAYITSMREWHVLRCSMVSPWSDMVHATTACTVAKVVRSSYNFALIAQLVLSIVRWRKQLTIDLLVGADLAMAVLRATGLGSLLVVLSINIVFARAGDLKMQEIKPSFAHVAGLLLSIVTYVTSASGIFPVRTVLVQGMTTISADELLLHSGCRGSSICAREVSLQSYVLLVVLIVVQAAVVGIVAQKLLQRIAQSRMPKALGSISSFTVNSARTPQNTPTTRNTFTRLLDERSRSTDMYDASTEVYIRDGLASADVYSTRAQIEACGFVPASIMLIRYRDLLLFLAARALPVRVLNCFNITATVFAVSYTGQQANGLPIVRVEGQTLQTHWTAFKLARLEWGNVCYGGESGSFLSPTQVQAAP